MSVIKKFEDLYRKIAVNKNYIEPKYPRMDNWAVDRWEMPVEGTGVFIAGMMDSGYSRYVGFMSEGKVVWRVDESYGHPFHYSGITETAFLDFINLN